MSQQVNEMQRQMADLVTQVAALTTVQQNQKQGNAQLQGEKEGL